MQVSERDFCEDKELQYDDYLCFRETLISVHCKWWSIIETGWWRSSSI